MKIVNKKLITPELLNEVAGGYMLGHDGIHGFVHWARVSENGLYLAERNGGDPILIELFALFHDCRRQNDGHDPEHGARAAELIRQLQGSLLNLTAEQLETLTFACEHHTSGHTHADPTIACCWDADRLDLGRLGYDIDPYFLSTTCAKDPQTIAWADQRSTTGQVPRILLNRWRLLLHQ
jgi:uncharacterized protein